jgi:CDP-glucose 4,6-dehydratase
MEIILNQSFFKSVYQGKKVFLTGHTGFKGTWMLSWLHLLGAEVKGYALDTHNSFDLFNVIEGENLCESVLADIRDRARLEKEITDFQPDFIFHLAAQPLVRLSYELPIDTFEINAIGTANVLEAMKKIAKPCVGVFITTDKVYENKEWHYPYRETDRLGGYDPYSASKALAEFVIDSYRNSFFNLQDFTKHQKAVASGRAGNVIGGGDWSKDRIIPDIIRSLQNNKPIEVRNPHAVRPWQHVLEPLAGYLILGAKLADNPLLYSGAWNFGPYMEDTLTVRELVEHAIRIAGKGTYFTPQYDHVLHEARLLKLDINKAVNELDWKPKYNAKQAIEMTLEWYQDTSISKSSMTEKQILNYLSQ